MAGETPQMLEDGTSFGSYEIIRLLGRGASGEVYLAKEALSGKLYAVKAMRPEALRDAEERFLREAEAAMSMRHPNLVEVYDAGLDPVTGLYYLIMEYMPAASLREELEKGERIGFERVARIAADVAAALAVIESHSLVHRDVKPANILLAADGTAKLADLGMSRSVEPETGDANITQAEDVVGTPAYMAPEQMLDSRAVDIRADIYSLGIVLYEMLAGRRPNEGENAMTTLARALDGREAPDVRLARPDTPAPLAALVASMIAPAPDRRPPSAAHVLAALAHPERIPINAVDRDADDAFCRQLPWYQDRSVLYALVALVVSLEALAVVAVNIFRR